MSFYVRIALYRAIIRAYPSPAKISSAVIGAKTGMDPSHVRRDLSKLGSNGKRGQGYTVGSLLPVLDLALAGRWDQVLEEIKREGENFDLILKDAP